MVTDDRTGTFARAHLKPGMAVHVRASFAAFDYDGRAVVDPVHLKRYPDSPLIAVRLGPPKWRKRRVYVAMSEILGPWEDKNNG